MSDRPSHEPGGPDEAQVRSRSVFIRDLAHEVSTPLTPLAGYLRILQGEKLGPLTEPQRKVVETMLVSVNRLARIVDNLADFASLGSERAPLSLETVEPEALAEKVVEDLRPAIRDGRLNVVVVKGGGGAVQADPRKLRQALANLVSNAVKFSPHGGEVLVEVAREAGRLRFAVYDQGPGVPEQDVVGLFEPFNPARRRGREELRHPGSGLGLPVARRIAEAHGGRVWLESPPRTQPAVAGGRHFTGARVTLEIPVAPSESPGPSAT
jgi:signal transduction histidine kinase